MPILALIAALLPQLFEGPSGARLLVARESSDSIAAALFAEDRPPELFRGKAVPAKWMAAMKPAAPRDSPAEGNWAGLLAGDSVRLHIGEINAVRYERRGYALAGESRGGLFGFDERDGSSIRGRLFGFADGDAIAGFWITRDGSSPPKPLRLWRAPPLPALEKAAGGVLAPLFKTSALGRCTRDRIWPQIGGGTRAMNDALEGFPPVLKDCQGEDDPPQSSTYAVTARSRLALAIEIRFTRDLAQTVSTNCTLIDLRNGTVQAMRDLAADEAALNQLALARLPAEVKQRLEEINTGHDEPVKFDSLCVKDGALIVRYVESDPPIYKEHDAVLPANLAAPALKADAALQSLLAH